MRETGSNNFHSKYYFHGVFHVFVKISKILDSICGGDNLKVASQVIPFYFHFLILFINT